jgi:hypothetical protein
LNIVSRLFEGFGKNSTIPFHPEISKIVIPKFMSSAGACGGMHRRYDVSAVGFGNEFTLQFI